MSRSGKSGDGQTRRYAGRSRTLGSRDAGAVAGQGQAARDGGGAGAPPPGLPRPNPRPGPKSPPKVTPRTAARSAASAPPLRHSPTSTAARARRIASGKVEIEARIDLHGLRQSRCPGAAARLSVRRACPRAQDRAGHHRQGWRGQRGMTTCRKRRVSRVAACSAAACPAGSMHPSCAPSWSAIPRLVFATAAKVPSTSSCAGPRGGTADPGA